MKEEKQFRVKHFYFLKLIGAIGIFLGVLIIAVILLYSIGIIFDLIKVRLNLPIFSSTKSFISFNLQ